MNFFEESYTQNGRAVFGMSDLARYRDATDVGTVDYLLILNRNENIIPAVAKLNQEQAAAYFMLGETTGTSAGGAAEAGKFLRVPGTNPFFPLPHGLQGNRILELLATHPIETFLLNTGRVGGKDGDERSKKVKIPHTSACVKGIAEGTISWTEDEDFGYQVAEEVPDFDDVELLQPRRLYEREGRMQEYDELVERLKAERVERLREFPELDEPIVEGGRARRRRPTGRRRPRKYPAASCTAASTRGTTKNQRSSVELVDRGPALGVARGVDREQAGEREPQTRPAR